MIMIQIMIRIMKVTMMEFQHIMQKITNTIPMEILFAIAIFSGVRIFKSIGLKMRYMKQVAQRSSGTTTRRSGSTLSSAASATSW